MRVAVVGSRHFRDEANLYFVLDKYNEKYGISHIISGGAVGADSLAEKYAKDRCIPRTIYPANWDRYGRGAGMVRNKQVVKDCEVLIAFPTKESVGTLNAIEIAEKAGKEVYVINLDK